MPVTNDNTNLTPRTSFDSAALTFEFPGVKVGVAEYDEGPTGCTVIDFGKRVLCAADIRGGSPGTFMADAGSCHALCFAGGSLLGLEAVAGVAAETFAMNGHKPGWENIPCVQGAIIFDMAGPNSVYPDKDLGRAAVRSAHEGTMPLGPHGAGRGARVGKSLGFEMAESGGQGGAFGQYGETKILVVTVVNALGAIIGRDGNVVRGNLDRKTGQRVRVEDDIARRLVAPAESPSPTNTTLTAVITNQRFGQRDLQQIGRQIHASMARCIQPFHTGSDGDVLFTATTFEVTNDALPAVSFGVLASELAWDAVLTSFEA